MPIKNGTILSGATISATGGTSSTLTSDGQTVQNGVHVIDASVTDFRVQPHITFKNRPAKVGSDGKWGKFKRENVLTIPKILADTSQGFPNIRVTLEGFPEMTQAEIIKLIDWQAQLFTDADFRSFWLSGAVE